MCVLLCIILAKRNNKIEHWQNTITRLNIVTSPSVEKKQQQMLYSKVKLFLSVSVVLKSSF